VSSMSSAGRQKRIYSPECQTTFRMYTAEGQRTEYVILSVRLRSECILLRDREQNMYY
jgi:hypothetical protein